MPQSQTDANRVYIFDTTLRDGEQSPGATMTFEEKLQVAALLDEMRVDINEAGFPVNGEEDFRAVSEIALRTKHATICALARAAAADIDSAGAAIRRAQHGRIHTFIATSPEHMQHKLHMTPDEVLTKVTWSVARARGLIDDVEWSAEDATHTDHDFLCRCVEAAIRAGATTINIPDTLGYMIPSEYGALFTMLLTRVPNADKARFSAHCHDDLALSVANSLAGVHAGARQVECTINGIGERAGNAALEAIVMALRVRNDALPYWTNIDATQFVGASKLVSHVTGFPVQYNKAIVGKNAFAHESGIHQDGMIKKRLYEIMQPQDVGREQSELVLGKHTGRAAVVQKIQELGYTALGDNELARIMRLFKDLLKGKKGRVYEEDLEALLNEEVAKAHNRIKLVWLKSEVSTDPHHSAVLELEIDGALRLVRAEGNGCIDAVFNAIQVAIPHDVVLDDYQVRAIGRGNDAQADVRVRLAAQGMFSSGTGTDPDTVVASARAYIAALCKLLIRLEKKVHSTDTQENTET